MLDYTPEGIRYNQNEIALSYLNLIDKKLKKINGRLTFLALLGLTLAIVKYRNDIKEGLENMKGE